MSTRRFFQATADEAVIDWFAVITVLSHRGWRQRALGAVLGVAPSTIHGWKQGAEPKYSDGKKLLTLWRRVMRDAREEARSDSAREEGGGGEGGEEEAWRAGPLAVPTLRRGDWRGYHG